MKKVIWVIDDDESILEVIKELLQNENFSVDVFSDSKTIDEKIDDTNYRPALIFLDVHMHRTDGRTVARRLKKQEKTKDIPIVLMTGDIHIEDKAKEAQANGFLKKPFGIEDLIGTINQYTNSKQA